MAPPGHCPDHEAGVVLTSDGVASALLLCVADHPEQDSGTGGRVGDGTAVLVLDRMA